MYLHRSPWLQQTLGLQILPHWIQQQQHSSQWPAVTHAEEHEAKFSGDFSPGLCTCKLTGVQQFSEPGSAGLVLQLEDNTQKWPWLSLIQPFTDEEL